MNSVLGGVIADARPPPPPPPRLPPPAPTCTNATTCHLERGGERKTAKWRSREAPVCRKECRRAPRLLSSLQTAGCCAFRKKHAATARPPVLWRNPRSEKKEREKTPTVLLFFLLLFLLLLLLFWLRLTDPQSELLRIEFFEKRTAGCSGECFSRMDFRDGM